MQPERMWGDFVFSNSIEASSYEICQFGMTQEDVDSLARLARQGTKQATTSLLEAYKLEGEPLPVVGAYEVVTDWAGNAVCIIRITDVEILPFREIHPGHAIKEGEGDKSLTHWRKAHIRCFTQEARELGLVFSESMEVVFVHFKTVYPQGGDEA